MTASDDMERLNREATKTMLLIADALGITKLLVWLERKLS